MQSDPRTLWFLTLPGVTLHWGSLSAHGVIPHTPGLLTAHRVSPRHPGEPLCVLGDSAPRGSHCTHGNPRASCGLSPGHAAAHVPAAGVAAQSRVPTRLGPSPPQGPEERTGLFLGRGVAADRRCQGAPRHRIGRTLLPRHRSHSCRHTVSEQQHSSARIPRLTYRER